MPVLSHTCLNIISAQPPASQPAALCLQASLLASVRTEALQFLHPAPYRSQPRTSVRSDGSSCSSASAGVAHD